MGSGLSAGGLLYLHGFCSSPAGWKTRLLGAAMAARGLAGQFCCPALPPAPAEAGRLLDRLIGEAGGPVTLIGSSLGGHYASWLAERHDLRAILINPAIIPALDLGRFIGEHRNYHTGEAFTFTPADAEDLRAQCLPPTPERYWLLLETGDEVLDYRAASAHFAGARQTVLTGGDHSFVHFPDFISQIIEFADIRPKV